MRGRLPSPLRNMTSRSMYWCNSNHILPTCLNKPSKPTTVILTCIVAFALVMGTMLVHQSMVREVQPTELSATTTPTSPPPTEPQPIPDDTLLDIHGHFFILHGGVRRYLPSCEACGSLVNVCLVLPRVKIIDESPIPRPQDEPNFDCELHMPKQIRESLTQYRFSEPTIVVMPNSVHHFARGNEVYELTTCMDCGVLKGSLCGSIPTMYLPRFVLSIIGRWDQQPDGKPLLFICRVHFPDFLPQPAHESWSILTSPHTSYMANMMAHELRSHDWTVEVVITTEARVTKPFDADMYIVFAAFIWDQLPPASKRICVQLEQESSHWFDDRYKGILRESLAVLEYNFDNLIFLQKEGITKNVWHLPLGAEAPATEDDSANFLSLEPSHAEQTRRQNGQKEYDVLFYGDLRSARRQSMLDALSKVVKVKVVTETFGDQMRDMIRRAQLVVNIHYFIPGQLEVFRIFECLSLGVPVISEDSMDRHLYPELTSPTVRFFDYNSTESLIQVVKAALATTPPSHGTISRVVRTSHARFAFMFHRMLFGMNWLPITSSILADLGSTFPLPSSIRVPVILSLPEVASRRKQFFNSTTIEVGLVFDAARHLYSPSWMSCALSYSTIAKLAMKRNLQTLSIAEDDAVFPHHFGCTMPIVEKYLNRLNLRHPDGEGWHLFSGIIADLHPDTVVSAVEVYQGVEFVTINKMTSTVFNVYSRRLLELLAAWDPLDGNVLTNTIDRYIERQTKLKVIVTIPYLVGHREDMSSTLWNFQNTQYTSMIMKSQILLVEKVAEFRRRAACQPKALAAPMLHLKHGARVETNTQAAGEAEGDETG